MENVLTAAATLGKMKEISVEDVRNLDNIMSRRGLPMFGKPGVNKSLIDLYYPEHSARFAGAGEKAAVR